MVALDIKNLQKSYGSIHAVKDISFQVQANSFTAFLGKNGAGKSTTINILATLLAKDSGTIKVFDYEVGIDDQKIRPLIGVVFQQNMLDNDLTVYENLRIRSALYHLSKIDFEQRLSELTQALNIGDFLHQKYGKLSGGQRRKADIARALLNRPMLLILDEPTTGLDPKSRKEIWDFINLLRKNQQLTILLTTHYLDEVYDADHVIVIDEGRIVDQDSSSALRAKYTKTKLLIRPIQPLSANFNFFNHPYTIIADRYQIILDNPFDALPFIEVNRPYLQSFEVLQGTMDDVFLSLTKEGK